MPRHVWPLAFVPKADFDRLFFAARWLALPPTNQTDRSTTFQVCTDLLSGGSYSKSAAAADFPLHVMSRQKMEPAGPRGQQLGTTGSTDVFVADFFDVTAGLFSANDEAVERVHICPHAGDDRVRVG